MVWPALGCSAGLSHSFVFLCDLFEVLVSPVGHLIRDLGLLDLSRLNVWDSVVAVCRGIHVHILVLCRVLWVRTIFLILVHVIHLEANADTRLLGKVLSSVEHVWLEVLFGENLIRLVQLLLALHHGDPSLLLVLVVEGEVGRLLLVVSIWRGLLHVLLLALG